MLLIAFNNCTYLNELEEIILIGTGTLESNTKVRNEDISYCLRHDGKSAADFGCCVGDSVKFETTNYCRSSLPDNRNTFYCTLLKMLKIE